MNIYYLVSPMLFPKGRAAGSDCSVGIAEVSSHRGHRDTKREETPDRSKARSSRGSMILAIVEEQTCVVEVLLARSSRTEWHYVHSIGTVDDT